MAKLKRSTKPAYKVVILAAGKGTRLSPLTDTINKALLPVNGKPVLTHILEKFPVETEVVIAVGYEREKIKEYISLAHPDRPITFVTVTNIDGPGSGPGYSLLRCQKFLQCPFIFYTADTLVAEDIPAPTQDWLGVAPVKDTSSFNSVALHNGFAVNMLDKVKSDNSHAFIGLCAVYSYKVFWKALQANKKMIAGEHQLSSGLLALVDQGMAGVSFTWHDTGTRENYEQACRAYSKKDQEFDFSKTGEHIYFIASQVIKFYADSEIAKKRVERNKYLKGFTPLITRSTKHFYAYDLVKGKTLYTVLYAKLAREFYEWLEGSFWNTVKLNKKDRENFSKACRKFYYDKTMGRIKDYYKATKTVDRAGLVNGQKVPTLKALLEQVDWDSLTNGLPSRFHGDLQFDNVLVTEDKKDPFLLLDWRQDFAGLTKYGDIYYDLAKMYGGHILPYNLIKKNMFSYRENSKEVVFDIASTYGLNESRAEYEAFIADRGFDLSRIMLLTALIFINMSPLHLPPFNKLLHHLGKLELKRALELKK